MALFKAFQAMSKLTKPQEQFLQDKTLTNSLTAYEWIRMLENICEFDEHGNTVIKWSKRLLIVCVIIALIAIFLFVLSPIIFTALLIIVGIVAIVCGILWYLFGLDVDDNVRHLILPLLYVLQLDVADDELITLSINARDSTHKKNIAPPGVFSTSHLPGDNKFYLRTLMDGNCQFVDGTRVKWRVFERIRKRSIWKTSRSGKRKYKIKHKIKQKLNVQVAFPRKHFSLLNNKVLSNNVHLTETDKRIVFKITDTRVDEGKTLILKADYLLKLIASAYNCVKLGDE